MSTALYRGSTMLPVLLVPRLSGLGLGLGVGVLILAPLTFLVQTLGFRGLETDSSWSSLSSDEGMEGDEGEGWVNGREHMAMASSSSSTPWPCWLCWSCVRRDVLDTSASSSPPPPPTARGTEVAGGVGGRQAPTWAASRRIRGKGPWPKITFDGPRLLLVCFR